MARQLRVEYPEAVYPVINHGDRREAIFKDDADRERFLETLGETCRQVGLAGPCPVFEESRDCGVVAGGDDGVRGVDCGTAQAGNGKLPKQPALSLAQSGLAECSDVHDDWELPSPWNQS